jgi:hypothetical protein
MYFSATKLAASSQAMPTSLTKTGCLRHPGLRDDAIVSSNRDGEAQTQGLTSGGPWQAA